MTAPLTDTPAQATRDALRDDRARATKPLTADVLARVTWWRHYLTTARAEGEKR